MPRHKIGIDGDALRLPLTGVGHYVFNICLVLEKCMPNTDFYVYSRLPASKLALPSKRWHLRNERHALLRHLPSFAWLKTRGRRMCIADGIDAFWAGRTIHPGLPLRIKTVATVHDVNHLIVPETMELSARCSHKLWFRRDLACASAIVANSHGTAERVTRMLQLPVSEVVTPGLAASFLRVGMSSADTEKAFKPLASMGIRPPYLLSVATLEPRKNVALVLQAFLELKRSGALEGFQLVLAGASGWRNRALERDIRAAMSQDVVLAGYVDDACMPALYAGAAALVFPSCYEGFGMPVLEARACGTPVVVSDLPELRESGGESAIVVDPSVAGVRDGILLALSGARPEVAENLAQKFSWAVVATPMIKLLGTSL